MIDIENKVIDTLSRALGDGITVYSTFELNPEEFPCVTVDYVYNGDLSKTFDNQLAPHHARVSVQVDSYAYDKATAKDINNLVVDTMYGMKFTCTESSFLGIYADGLVRVMARFSAIVEEGVDEDGTTTFQMYRRQ